METGTRTRLFQKLMGKFWGLFIISCCLVLGLANCQSQPDAAQLDFWQKQAIDLNASITQTIADQNQNNPVQEWYLTIHGQVQQKSVLRLSELQNLSQQEIKTTNPHNTENRQEIETLQGIAVSQLLEKAGVEPSVQEVTFLSSNNYRVTVSLEDLKNYPILLAWGKNGKPLSRSEGGPLYLVFPYSDYPELPDRYSDAFWAFYVTDMIVGNEPGMIKVDIKPFDVGSKVFDRAALDALPQTSIEEPVGYKFGWPVGKVKLTGVKLRDIITAANIDLTSQGRVFIKGKASLSSEPQEPVQLPSQEVLNCDIILATRWGEDAIPIPSSMGGPITLAFSDRCQNGVTLSPKNSQHWATLVERVEVN